MASKVGEIIRDYRKKMGYTQFQFAERVGISEFYISAIETGRRIPGRNALVKISQEMNIPVEGLLDLATDSSVMYATSDLYERINGLPEEKRKLAFLLIDAIIDILKSE